MVSRLVAAVLAALALTACTGSEATPEPAVSVQASAPGAGADDAAGDGAAGQGPERTGDRLRVLGSEGPDYTFEVFAQDSVDGVCLELQDDDGGVSLGCGFEVPERQDVGFFVHEGSGQDGDHAVVVGSVLSQASSVRVELASGEPLVGEVVPVEGLDSSAFAVDLGQGKVLSAVVALAADGTEIGRREA